jgi:hypothetical protein
MVPPVLPRGEGCRPGVAVVAGLAGLAGRRLAGQEQKASNAVPFLLSRARRTNRCNGDRNRACEWWAKGARETEKGLGGSKWRQLAQTLTVAQVEE